MEDKKKSVKSWLIIIANKFSEPGISEPCLNIKSLLADSEEFHKVQAKATERALTKYGNGYHQVTHYLEEEREFLGFIKLDSYVMYCPKDMNDLKEYCSNHKLTEEDVLRAFPKIEKKEENLVIPDTNTLELAYELAEDITESNKAEAFGPGFSDNSLIN